MMDYWPGWLEYSDRVQVELIGAHWRRMNRPPAETESLYARLARQRIRFILNGLVNR